MEHVFEIIRSYVYRFSVWLPWKTHERKKIGKETKSYISHPLTLSFIIFPEYKKIFVSQNIYNIK